MIKIIRKSSSVNPENLLGRTHCHFFFSLFYSFFLRQFLFFYELTHTNVGYIERDRSFESSYYSSIESEREICFQKKGKGKITRDNGRTLFIKKKVYNKKREMQIEDGEHDVPAGGYFTPKLYIQR